MLDTGIETRGLSIHRDKLTAEIALSHVMFGRAAASLTRACLHLMFGPNKTHTLIVSIETPQLSPRICTKTFVGIISASILSQLLTLVYNTSGSQWEAAAICTPTIKTKSTGTYNRSQWARIVAVT
jgi:hypothetical protein